MNIFPGSWIGADLTLQSPVIRRAGLAVSLLHIHIRNPGIMLDHFQAVVAQQVFERENISSKPVRCKKPNDWYKPEKKAVFGNRG
jgi:hypothetical protein